MYRIYADNMLIYDDTRMEDTLRLVSPKLTLEDNAAGSLVITVPPGNAGYDTIEQLNTTIRVEKDGAEIWEGRVLQERKDFWNERVLTCEGELAYLNDIVIPQEKKSFSRALGGSALMAAALTWIIGKYNAKVDDSKKFYVGAVTVSKPVGDLDIFTDYENPLTLIRSKLINEFGGHLKISKVLENGVTKRYIQYLSDSSLNTNSQVIEFGKNLEDFTSSLDGSDYATVVLPLGKKKTDRSEDSEVEEYVMLTDASPALVDTDILDSIYVKAHTPTGGESPLTTFGRIERVLKFDNEEDPQNLLLMAKDYLANIQYEDLVLELTALDLHYLNPEIESVKICDVIRVKSAPHNLDKEFIVQKLEIPLDSPENAKITLGGTVRVSLTSSNNKVNTQLKEQAERAPNVDTDAIIEQVDQNVSAIMNQTTQGYVTILTETDQAGVHSEAMYISSQKYNSTGQTTQDKFGQRYWKWYSGGLGYTSNGGSTWDAAITMDGTIKGNYIAAGTIYGSKLATNALTLVTTAGDTACSIKIEDERGTTIATAQNIQINGMVTFASLSNSSSTDTGGNVTYIDGAHIKTGTISADMVDTSSLKVRTVYNAADNVVMKTGSSSGTGGLYAGDLQIGMSQADYNTTWPTGTESTKITMYGTIIVFASHRTVNGYQDMITFNFAEHYIMPNYNNINIGSSITHFKDIYADKFYTMGQIINFGSGNDTMSLYASNNHLYFQGTSGSPVQIV